MASLSSARHETSPYDYWLLEDMVPEETVDALLDLPLAVTQHADFSGKRDSYNECRVYFTPENQERMPVCKQVADAFKDEILTGLIEKLMGTDLSGTALRIEYAQDVDGFWLEPHVDVAAKRFSMMIYLSDASELHGAGTDIYDATPEHNRIATAPYGRNKGMIFIPGPNTWHGFTPRPLQGVRKSLIINYVDKSWHAREELA